MILPCLQAISICLAHLSKGRNGFKPFSCSIFYALWHGVISFALSISSSSHQILVLGHNCLGDMCRDKLPRLACINWKCSLQLFNPFIEKMRALSIYNLAILVDISKRRTRFQQDIRGMYLDHPIWKGPEHVSQRTASLENSGPIWTKCQTDF